MAAFLPLLIGVGFLVLINRGAGIQGLIVQPDCVYPVLTTPCQIQWLPLKAQVRVFRAVPRPDGISDPGPLLTTAEAGPVKIGGIASQCWSPCGPGHSRTSASK